MTEENNESRHLDSYNIKGSAGPAQRGGRAAREMASQRVQKMFGLTTSLTPALSLRRGGNVRCVFGMPGDGIGRTIIRESENAQRRLLLLGGEGWDEGGR